jgi:hypothetical protein
VGVLPIFMVKRACYRCPTFEVASARDKSALGGEAFLFSKSRYLRGLKSGGGSSDGEHPERTPSMTATSASPKAAANDAGATEQAAEKSSRSWPFAHALGFALLISAALWAIIAAVIHYF